MAVGTIRQLSSTIPKKRRLDDRCQPAHFGQHIHSRIHRAELGKIRGCSEQLVEKVRRFRAVHTSVLEVPAKLDLVTCRYFVERVRSNYPAKVKTPGVATVPARRVNAAMA